MLVFPYNQSFCADFDKLSQYLDKRGYKSSTYMHERINSANYSTPTDFITAVNNRLQALFSQGRFIPFYLVYQVADTAGEFYPSSNFYSPPAPQTVTSAYFSAQIFCYDNFGRLFYNYPNQVGLFEQYIELTNSYINEENLVNATHTFFAIEGFLISR